MNDTNNSIELVKIAYKQTRQGDVITFRIHNDDKHKGLSDVALGSRVAGVFMSIKDDERQVEIGPET